MGESVKISETLLILGIHLDGAVHAAGAGRLDRHPTNV
jgi:hypothetical protein